MMNAPFKQSSRKCVPKIVRRRSSILALTQAAANPFLIAWIGSPSRFVKSHSPVVWSAARTLKTPWAVQFNGNTRGFLSFPLSNQKHFRQNQHAALFDFAVARFIAEVNVLFPDSQYLFRRSDAGVFRTIRVIAAKCSPYSLKAAKSRPSSSGAYLGLANHCASHWAYAPISIIGTVAVF